MLLPLSIFVLGYLCFVFPFAGMRHDDWLNLNSALFVKLDPSFLWRATWIEGTHEVAWFFRPAFKALQLLVYECFGLEYRLWLTVPLIATALACIGFAKTLRVLKPERERPFAFVLLFCVSIPFHIGSLAWAGEGLINAPQVALLAWSTYFFVRHAAHSSKRDQIVSLLLFAFALGFKESTVFHSAFLLTLCMSEERIRVLNLRRRAQLLLPYAALCAFYLGIRLGAMPINPSYAPDWSVSGLLTPLAIILALFAIPVCAFIGVNRKIPKVSSESWWYLPFFAVSFAPLLGHPFFSPGWMLYPGMIFTFAIASRFPASALYYRGAIAISAFALSIAPVLWQMNRIGWWQWKNSQDHFIALMRELPATVEELTIEECENPRYPTTSLARVIASPQAIEAAAAIPGLRRTSRPLRVQVFPCNDSIRAPASAAIVRWNFPDFVWQRLP